MTRRNLWIVGILVLLLSVQVASLHAAEVHESSDALHTAEPVVDATCEASTGMCTAPDAQLQETSSTKEFVPTNVWQQVHPNQAIPPGLHVRVNLATGLKEAKLMSEEGEESDQADDRKNAKKSSSSSSSSSRDLLPVLVDDHTEEEEVEEMQQRQQSAKKTPIVTHLDTTTREQAHAQSHAQTHARTQTTASGNQEEDDLVALDDDTSEPELQQVTAKEPNWNDEKIYEVLRALPEPPQVNGWTLDDAKAKLNQQEFRRHMVYLWRKRQRELKEAMESIQDDARYFLSILEDFEKAKDTPSEQVRLLEVLEWEVSDMDKALVFNYIGGFDVMVKTLNTSDFTVRANVAWLIGSAVKNYHEAQNWALDAGSLPELLQLLSLKVSLDDASSIEQTELFELKKKALYAVAALVRGNERAQQLLLVNDGIAKLEALTDEVYPLNLRLKVVLLLHDLLLEQPIAKAKAEPVEVVDQDVTSPLTQLQNVFRSSRWCQITASVFKEVNASFKKQLLVAMLHQLPNCAQDFRDIQVQNHLQVTAEFWQQHRQQDKEEFAEMQQLIQQVQSQL